MQISSPSRPSQTFACIVESGVVFSKPAQQAVVRNERYSFIIRNFAIILVGPFFISLSRSIQTINNKPIPINVSDLQVLGKCEGQNIVVVEGDGTVQDGASQVQLSRMLPLLQELSCFVRRCEQVIVLVVHQLAAFYTSARHANKVINAVDVHLQVSAESQSSGPWIKPKPLEYTTAGLAQ